MGESMKLCSHWRYCLRIDVIQHVVKFNQGSMISESLSSITSVAFIQLIDGFRA